MFLVKILQIRLILILHASRINRSLQNLEPFCDKKKNFSFGEHTLVRGEQTFLLD